MDAGTKNQSDVKVKRVAVPPTEKEARRSFRIAEEGLARKTRVLNELAELASRGLKGMPQDELDRALEAAKEEFGLAAALYADCLAELNAVCDALVP